MSENFETSETDENRTLDAAEGQVVLVVPAGEAIAACIDRAEIQKVLLQNNGKIAGGILAHWLSGDGYLISSAEWPARFGYREDWLIAAQVWATQGALLKREELPDRIVLGLERCHLSKKCQKLGIDLRSLRKEE